MFEPRVTFRHNKPFNIVRRLKLSLIIVSKLIRNIIARNSSFILEELLALIYKPGTELLSRGATPKVSSPQQCFTSEFGMGSVWCHCAIRTRKTVECKEHPEDYIATIIVRPIVEVKPSVY